MRAEGPVRASDPLYHAERPSGPSRPARAVWEKETPPGGIAAVSAALSYVRTGRAVYGSARPF